MSLVTGDKVESMSWSANKAMCPLCRSTVVVGYNNNVRAVADCRSACGLPCCGVVWTSAGSRRLYRINYFSNSCSNSSGASEATAHLRYTNV